MKKTLFSMAVIAALCTGCQIELTPVSQPKGDGMETVTIFASIDADDIPSTDEVATKSTVDGSGIYSWQESEKISVVAQDGTEGIDFTLSDAPTGAFTGTKPADKDLVFAVSPKTALTSALESGGDVLYDITLPAEYTNYVPGTTNAVMIGTPNGGGYKFNFRHAAALLKFTYVNVPVGTKKFVFDNTNNFVQGTWSNLDSTSGVALSENDTNFSADGYSVTLTLENAVYEANTTLDFYVPVPASTYKDFAVELQDNTSTRISGTNKSKAGLTIPLAAGDIFPCPTISLAVATKGSTWNPTLSTKDDLSTSGATLGGLTVTSSVNPGSFESSSSARGCQFSSGADPTITIPYADHIESVVVVCSANNAASTVAVTVDDIALGSTQDISNGVANETHTFKIATNGRFRKGTIKVIVTNGNGSKSTWIKSITINGDVRYEASLSYAETAVAKATGAANFTNTLSNPNSLEGITYTSSDTDVATVNASTGEVTVKAAGETTITASYAGGEFYKAGNASYTLTVAAAYLTLPGATTPAKADCVDNSTVTFDVDSNIDWTAAKGTDDDSIIKSVSTSGSTVTVTFNANTGAEKTAQVTITPVEVGYRATLTKNITVTQKEFEKADILTQSLTGLTTSGTSGYTAWSNKSYSGSGHSDAVYAGNTNKGVAYLQMNGTSGNSIVTTTSGGAITKVSVVWAADKATNTGRTLTVYGKNTAYSGPSDTSSDGTRGTSLGTIIKGTNNSVEISGYYEYIALVADGAMYFDEINVFWTNAKAANGLEWQKNGSLATTDSGTLTSSGSTLPTAELYNPNSLSVAYSSSDESVATINASTGVVALVAAGTTTIKATFAGDATYKPGEVSYTLTVSDTRDACATPSFSPGAGAVAANTVVTISSATTGSTIYYTTNGDTPTVGGATTTAGTAGAATASVTIDAIKTIKAIAVKEPGNKPSAMASATYTISGGKTFSRITAIGDLTVGAEYLLVYVPTSGDPLAFNGSLAKGSLNGSAGVTVSITDNKIDYETYKSYAITISDGSTSGKYYIKTASNVYIGKNANNNGIDTGDEGASTLDNTITFSSNKVKIAGNGGRELLYFPTNSNFKYYSSSNNDNMYLFKYVSD